MPVKVVYSEKLLEYEEKGHPESPERLKAIESLLRKRKDSFEFITPAACGEKELLLAHTEELVRKVKENDFFDPDTPNIAEIYSYALLSCGAAVDAARIALGGEKSFSLARPPGHHAGRNGLGGFCYFNNMAVAVKKILLETGLRVAVLDIDGHHGNGTEEILKGEDSVIYVSLHQYPAFPGTGGVSFGNCHNFPVLPGVDSRKYMDKFVEALGVIKNFSPDVLGISAGFDGHRDDPLLNLMLEDTHFYRMGRAVSRITGKIFVLLEGGYNVKTLGNTCFCFLNGLSGR